MGLNRTGQNSLSKNRCLNTPQELKSRSGSSDRDDSERSSGLSCLLIRRRGVGRWVSARSLFQCGDPEIAEQFPLMAGSVPRYQCCDWVGVTCGFECLEWSGESGGVDPQGEAARVFRVFWPILDGCGKPPAGIELIRWKEMTWKNVGSECVRSLLMRCEVLVSAAERLPHLSLVAAL